MEKKTVSGIDSVFIYRGWGQTSMQATVERPKNPKPLPIPRSGTSAPVGLGATLLRTIKTKGR